MGADGAPIVRTGPRRNLSTVQQQEQQQQRGGGARTRQTFRTSVDRAEQAQSIATM